MRISHAIPIAAALLVAACSEDNPGGRTPLTPAANSAPAGCLAESSIYLGDGP
jgi:hypothetical protein